MASALPRLLLPALAAALFTACLEPVPEPPSGALVSLVPSGAEWRYLDDGTDPGEGWATPDFDAAAWPMGPALLGFGVGDESTVLRCRPELEPGEPCPQGVDDPTLTYYLRRDFEVSEPERFSRLRLRLIKDDGAIVYLNGEVVARANMRPGIVGFNQPAAGQVEDRLVWREYRFDSRKLKDGRNVLAVELHLTPSRVPRRASTTGFDLELTGFDPAASALIRGPFPQLVSGTSAVVRWKTSDAVATEIRWGNAPEALEKRHFDEAPKSEHEVRLDALEPGSTVHYQVAAGGRRLSTEVHSFRTAPDISESVRLWITGGLGAGDRFARRTALAMQRFTEDDPPEIWLSLGDNAYERGSEEQFDQALFEPFQEQLAHLVFLPALGNRDVRTGKDPSDIPFYRLFALPGEGQMGGLASGSEDYYAVDWGPVHLVCLNTVTGNLSPEKEMLTWLGEDLAANEAAKNRPFTIVYFHHPPYSKGFFDTDDAEKSGRSFGVRQNVLPILEEHGVDVVLAGRTPSYERSHLLHGHYGTSKELESKMLIDDGDGSVSGDGAYRKKEGGRGTLYVTAGGAATSVEADFGHPAMAFSTAERGSLIIDVTEKRLDLRFLTSSGAVADHVTLLHSDK